MGFFCYFFGGVVEELRMKMITVFCSVLFFPCRQSEESCPPLLLPILSERSLSRVLSDLFFCISDLISLVAHKNNTESNFLFIDS